MTSARFDKVQTELDFPRDEREILSFWKTQRIFDKSLELTKDGTPFVFYEGPPTANGMPHNGHVLTRVIKDIFPRYKTMKGFHVARKAGWDTHGLPVEVEVEKELRIHGKAAIDAYGVEPFVKKCIDSVFRYTKEWEDLTERVAFWVDLPSAYVTYHKSYVESVWWALSELFKKGLLYQGHKVLWWWAQGGTALSSAEVGLGYKDVDDPSVFVAFPLEDEPGTALAVWTTTPWTLPSNMYAAVNPKFDYAVVQGDPEKVKAPWAKQVLGTKLIVAKDMVEGIAKKLGTTLTVEKTLAASELVGKAYKPPFDLYTQGGAAADPAGPPATAWKVIGADFVTLDAGTGIVHIAPAFGEDDFGVHRKLVGGEATIFCAVKPDGTFIPEMGKYAGRWVKDADKELIEELKERGVLVHAETYRHPYPFCWRADNDPLIQLARPAWYIKTTSVKDAAIANNRAVKWLPEHIKEGRMGDFLANNVDWALSRERYWGTPLNIWINDVTGKMEAPASMQEILAKNPKAFDHFHEAKKKDPSLSEHLVIHKPWIDQVTWENPGEEGTYRRVPEVIDCWFDSGSMPFAQWGFPHAPGSVEQLQKSFPADFISEAIDQTRGWFYGLLMISTLLFDAETQKRFGLAPVREYPHPYKTCIVLGHVSDKEGKKESKSKGNYTPPELVLSRVSMDFAVLAEAKGLTAEKGVALIAKEDLEGMDLRDGGAVDLEASTGAGALSFAPQRLKVKAGKGLPRRVVVLHEADRASMSLDTAKAPGVKPVEVPWLPANERVTIFDPSTPAPGADAFRWFFFAASPPWSSTRHALSNVRDLQKETLVKLRNVYSFFTIYANIDGFDPSQASSDPTKRSEIDRWILSELNLLVQGVTADLDGYDVYGATGKISAFVDALSNWYVRRSRDRFWRAGDVSSSAGGDADKRAAYETLYEALTTLAGVMAPFTPYQSEAIYRNLVVKGKQAAGAESVHLTTFPEANLALVDRQLSQTLEAVRDVVSLGLQVRTHGKLKVRQPLSVAKIILADPKLADRLAPYREMMKNELNVLAVEIVTEGADEYVTYRVKPNFRTLGQKGMGAQAQQLKKFMTGMSAADAQALVASVLASGGATVDGVAIEQADLEVAFDAKEGYAAAGERIGVVVLDTRLNDELRDLGYLRELQNRIQTARKEIGLDFVDRIHVRVQGTDRATRIAKAHGATIESECLATSLEIGPPDDGSSPTREIDVEGDAIQLWITKQ
jgi:isoleucyl-tRNA synthetase